MTQPPDRDAVLKEIAFFLHLTLGKDVNGWLQFFGATPFGVDSIEIRSGLEGADDPSLEWLERMVHRADAMGWTILIMRSVAKLHPEVRGKAQKLLEELAATTPLTTNEQQQQQQQQQQSADPQEDDDEHREVSDGPEIHTDLPTTLPDESEIPSILDPLLPPTILSPPTTISNTTNPRGAEEAPRVESLRLDTAVPQRVVVGQAFKLAVSVRQLASALLNLTELPRVESGDLDVLWMPGQAYLSLRIEVNAPDCTIDGDDTRSFKLFPGRDSGTFYFHLTPKRHGNISIFVTVYQDQDSLGTAGLSTSADEDAPAPRVAGEVQVTLTTTQKLDKLVPKGALNALYQLIISIRTLSRDVETPLLIAEQAGLDRAFIEQSTVPADQWWKVLVKAHKEQCVPAIADAVEERYPKRSEDINAALAVYSAAVVAVP